MNKNLNGIIVVLVIVGLGYFAYKKLGKPNSRKVVTNYLDATFGGDHSEGVKNLGKKYIDSWSNAIMNGYQTFEVSDKTYLTKTGKVKQ